MDSVYKGFDINKSEHLDALVCNQRWPVCLFDFTYKNRVPDYFAFRVHSSAYNIIPDYFNKNGKSLTDSEHLMIKSEVFFSKEER